MPVDQQTLIDKVKAAGVVGAGGAGFPTHIKLSGDADTVIINGAECEPLLAVDVQLLEQEAAVMVGGLDMLVVALGAREGIIALKARHKGAIARLQQALADQGDTRVRLHLLPDFYPVGDEPILVYEVLGRVIPQGGLPLALKCLVLNVETLRNIVGALSDQPVVSTCLTVAGAVKNPLTLEVPVGTPIKSLVDLAGGPTIDHWQVVEGGPMTGKAVSQKAVEALTAAVSKTTKGLLVLPADHVVFRQGTVGMDVILQRAQSACCQCRLCTDLCPRYLLGYDLQPHLMLNRVNHGQSNDPMTIAQAFLCSDCGVCELYACPVGLSPRRVYMELKQELTSAGAPNPHFQSREIASPRHARAGRQVPAGHLRARLGLGGYDEHPRWTAVEFTPRQVAIALKQHVGAPGVAQVAVGDVVGRGQVIAAPPEGLWGAVVHSSIAGKVCKLTEEMVVIRGG